MSCSPISCCAVYVVLLVMLLLMHLAEFSEVMTAYDVYSISAARVAFTRLLPFAIWMNSTLLLNKVFVAIHVFFENICMSKYERLLALYVVHSLFSCIFAWICSHAYFICSHAYLLELLCCVSQISNILAIIAVSLCLCYILLHALCCIIISTFYCVGIR